MTFGNDRGMPVSKIIKNLERERNELAATLGNDSRCEISHHTGDSAADAAQEREINEEASDRMRRKQERLDCIDRALRHWRESYPTAKERRRRGKCANPDCNEIISGKRLSCLPYTTTCGVCVTSGRNTIC